MHATLGLCICSCSSGHTSMSRPSRLHLCRLDLSGEELLQSAMVMATAARTTHMYRSLILRTERLPWLSDISAIISLYTTLWNQWVFS